MAGPWEQFKPAAEPVAGAKPWEQFGAPAKEKGFGEQLNDFVSSVPRQTGLTARYALEGLGGTFDSFVGNPLRTLAAPILGNSPRADTGGALANVMGLPTPANAQERVVGDAARLAAGSAGIIGAAGKAATMTSGTTQAVARGLAAAPVKQLASGAAAGGAGGYTRETGGNEGSQLLASLAAGVAAPFAVGGAQRAASAIGNRSRPPVPPAQQQIQIDIKINNALEQSGLKLGDLPGQVAQSIRDDVAKAYKISPDLSPDAVRRLADYRLTGTTPTAAGLLRDPGTFTRQKNLAKVGANSKDPAAQQLSLTEEANSHQLTAGLNGLGAATADDVYAGGSKVIGALEARSARAKELIGKRYDAARAADGRSASLDPYAFTQRASDLLDDALLGGKLPADVRNLLNKAANGEMPLTVDVAEQFKTRIGELQRSTMDMAERKALGMVRTALDDTPLLPGQQIGREAMDAFGRARSLNRKWMGIVEKTPALQAVRDGIEPDKFIQQFIVGTGGKSNVMDVAMLKSSVKSSPEAMDAVREQITSFLKSKALNGASDEVGKFSQSGYNKALSQIGDRKLRLFFSPEQIAQMKAIGRVASYEQVQPVGSAVNNANTAAAGGAMLLDRIASNPWLSRIPFGKQAIAEPLQNIALGMQANRAMNVPLNIAGPRAPAQLRARGLMLSPAALMGMEGEEDRQRRLLAAPPR